MPHANPETLPLVVGPFPPPIGGIATIVAKLSEWPGVAASVQFLDTAKRTQGLARPLRLLSELNRRLRGRPAHVLIFSSAHASFWEKGLWLMLSRWRRVPMTVMMVDGNFPQFYTSLPAPLRATARWLLERFSTVIVQTESWKRFYSEIAPRGRYRVLPNGIDCEEFILPEREVTSIPVILFVGWMIREKGIFDLLEAVRLLSISHTAFTVRLVGPYHGNESILRAQIAEAGLNEIIELAGPIHSREKILAAYRSADVFVLPSWAEGLPVSLLEAMASGLPVVTSDVGGMPDLVQDDVCGLLVPPRNPSALAVALERLIVSRDMRWGFGRAARARVESAFSNEAFIKGILALLCRS